MRQRIVFFDGRRHHGFQNCSRREDACQHREEEDYWVHGREPDSIEGMDIGLRHFVYGGFCCRDLWAAPMLYVPPCRLT